MGSNAKIFMSNAFSFLATSRPMCPKPTSPMSLALQVPAMFVSLLVPPSLSHGTILDRDSTDDRQEQPDGVVRYGVGDRLGRVGDDDA